jgi:hypothetical protein
MMPRCRQNLHAKVFSRLARMPRRAAAVPALALVAALGLALGGCGEEDAALLPGSTAREITANLEAVEQLAGEGECSGAESAALQVGEQVDALQGVDPRLKRALVQGADRLEEVVARCDEELEATEPLPDELETDAEAEEREREGEELRKEEDEERKEEKELEKEAKEREKAEEGDEEENEGSPSLPPQAEGEGKGLDEDSAGGPDGGGSGGSSGGVSPASPAGEG